ncbi:MAG: ATPase [Candidatus Omnitrophota bacterium]
MTAVSICKKCILTSGTPGITFDRNGICNYCLKYIPMKVEGEAKLAAILERFRNGKGKYDCMVCVSGGRDSTYTLWKVAHDYKMKVLAVNYKNPFTSGQARENIQRSVRTLKVDFYDWEFPNDAHRIATAKALKAWSHHPSSALIPIVCMHCKTIWPTLYRIARDYGIPLIVVGTNPLETASFKRSGMGGARYYHKLSFLPRLIGKSVEELIKNPRYLTKCSWAMILKMYLCAGHNSPYLRWRFKDIEVVRLFDYLRWNEKEVMTTITDNLGWQKSAEVQSPWRFDCRLDYIRRLMYEATVGVTELRDLFSKMIREGMISRDEALVRIEAEDKISEAIAGSVLSDMGMKMADLNLDKH